MSGILATNALHISSGAGTCGVAFIERRPSMLILFSVLFTRYVQKVRGLLMSFFTWIIKTNLVDMNQKSVFISKSKITITVNFNFL
jgi:hypothetical protein